MKKIILIFLLLFFHPSFALNPDLEAIFQKATQHFNGDGVEQDKGRAIELLKEAASGGHPGAMLELGTLYYYGVDGFLEKDLKEARRLFEQASLLEENPDSQAQYNLSLMYEKGQGGVKDSVKSHYWLEQSAINGSVKSQYTLGLKYQSGIGVEPDPELTVYWFKEAISGGLIDANYQLALAFVTGNGVERDWMEARKLLEHEDLADHEGAISLLKQINQ